MKERFDIFISYRRDGGFETAKHLHDLFVHDGYTVSFDIDTLREGDFDDMLFKRIDQCVDFILIVDKHAFDRTLDTRFDHRKDWLRQELSYALSHHKNVIPVLLSGVDGFPENLPDDIADVAMKNYPEYNRYYFDEFYKRLKVFLHSEPQKRRLLGGRSNVIRWIVPLTAVLLAIAGIGLGIYKCSPSQGALLVSDSTIVNSVMGEYSYTDPVDENREPHGKGKAFFIQGDIYEGDFVHGVFEGKCIYHHYQDGDKFVGIYKSNQRSEGTYVWSDGTYFSGSFKDNLLFDGTLYDVDGNVLDEYKEGHSSEDNV